MLFFTDVQEAKLHDKYESVAVFKALDRYRGYAGFTTEEAEKLLDKYEQAKVGFCIYVSAMNGLFNLNLDEDGEVVVHPISITKEQDNDDQTRLPVS